RIAPGVEACNDLHQPGWAFRIELERRLVIIVEEKRAVGIYTAGLVGPLDFIDLIDLLERLSQADSGEAGNAVIAAGPGAIECDRQRENGNRERIGGQEEPAPDAPNLVVDIGHVVLVAGGETGAVRHACMLVADRGSI